MTLLRLLLAVLAVGLTALIFWAMGADGRPLGAVLAALVADPWTVVTLVDLYLGFFIAAVIIVLAEKRLWVGLLWALPIFVLGNLWTAAWLALRLPWMVARLRRGG